jgi:hypothetical protein
LDEQSGNTPSKDNDMPDIECRYTSEAAVDLILQRRTSGSAIASLELAIHRHADWFGVILFALSMCQLSLLGQGNVPRYIWGVFATLWIALVACFLLDRFMFARQPASPAYIEAALRRLESEGRVALLERIEKALCRCEFQPVLKSDVVEMLKLIERVHSIKLAKRQKRERHTAKLQAAFIDLFRQV